MKRYAAVFAVILLLLSGCSKSARSADLFAMDTLMTFTVYGSENDVSAAKDEVRRLEALFSVTDGDSEVSQLNALHEAELSPDTLAIITRAVELAKRTDGAFDPTVRAAGKLWGFTGDHPALPDDALIKAALSKVDYSQIKIDGSRVACDGEIDLGGIAKGYAAAALRKKLTGSGVKSAALSLGGNVAVIGAKPDGSAWKVGIRDPEGDGVFGTVTAANTAVVTSGGYERYFIENGVTYHHIIDPKTGYPADSGIVSATVISEDDTLADAMSTAVYVMGAEKAEQLWRGSDDFELVLVTDDGRVIVTEGVEQSFVLIRDSLKLSVIRR